MAQASRPLSPHLQIYRWYVTMALSIVHRATGVILTVGLLGLTWWLLALAGGPDSYATFQAITGNILGWLILFGLTFALFMHAAGGARHLIWDLGYGLDKHTATQTSYLVVGVAVGLTLLTWLAILILR